MFRERYTKDNDKIKPEESLNRYIKAKMKQEKTPKAYPVRGVAFIAAVVCFCIVASIFLKPNTPSVITPTSSNTALLNTAEDYADIYDSIEELHTNWVRLYGGTLVDYTTDNSAQTGNGSLKGEASKPSAGAIEESAGTNVDNAGAMGEDEAHSETNNQVEGVDEADVVKTDGEYIYSLCVGTLRITKASKGEMTLTSELKVAEDDERAVNIYVNGDKLAVIIANYNDEASTIVRIYSIADKAKPEKIKELSQSGNHDNSRMIGDTVYILSEYYIRSEIERDDPTTYIPCKDGELISATDITCIEELKSCSYLVISAVDINKAEITASEAILGGAENVYCDADSLYYTYTKSGEEGQEYTNKSVVVKLSLSSKDIKTVASGEVKGTPLNQFSMDEYEGNLRIVTTVTKIIEKDVQGEGLNEIITRSSETSNALYVLDKDLKIIGSLEDLAPDERVYSVRFDGAIGYFVTFRQVDPLFTVDLSEPTKPKILSELKIPGFSDYLHPFGEGKLFGFGQSATELGVVTGLKLSMFDVSDPADVSEENTISLKADFSEASSNHKAIMVDYSKNIIAFTTMDYVTGKSSMYVYGYDEEKGFYLKAETEFGKFDFYDSRFVWIGEYFYFVSNSGIHSFSLDTFEVVSTLEF